MPARPGLRPARRTRPAAQRGPEAAPSSGAAPTGPRPHRCPGRNPRPTSAGPAPGRRRPRRRPPRAPPAQPSPASSAPHPPAPGAGRPPPHRRHLPPTAKTASAMSGRHRFKNRAAALRAPRIGCRSHRPSVSRRLIRHLSEMPCPLPRPFWTALRLLPPLVGCRTCRSWLSGLPLAVGRFLSRRTGQVAVPQSRLFNGGWVLRADWLLEGFERFQRPRRRDPDGAGKGGSRRPLPEALPGGGAGHAGERGGLRSRPNRCPVAVRR